VKAALAIFVVAAAVNYPWELAQRPFYAGMAELSAALLHCLRAALGDGVLVLAIYGAGVVAFRRRDWFRRPGWPGYAFMFAAGLALAVAVEWAALQIAQRWSYSERMPLIGGIGVVPLLQMLVLPPLAFFLVAKWVRI
jgi:hypothetical protein